MCSNQRGARGAPPLYSLVISSLTIFRRVRSKCSASDPRSSFGSRQGKIVASIPRSISRANPLHHELDIRKSMWRNSWIITVQVNRDFIPSFSKGIGLFRKFVQMNLLYPFQGSQLSMELIHLVAIPTNRRH